MTGKLFFTFDWSADYFLQLKVIWITLDTSTTRSAQLTSLSIRWRAGWESGGVNRSLFVLDLLVDFLVTTGKCDDCVCHWDTMWHEHCYTIGLQAFRQNEFTITGLNVNALYITLNWLIVKSTKFRKFVKNILNVLKFK